MRQARDTGSGAGKVDRQKGHAILGGSMTVLVNLENITWMPSLVTFSPDQPKRRSCCLY